MQTLSTFSAGDTTARFLTDAASGRVGFELFPAAMAGDLATRREDLRRMPEIDGIPDSGLAPAIVVHVKIVGAP